MLCILEVLGSLGGAEICRPSLRPHRRCLPWDTLQDQNHGEGQESSITSAARESKLLALGSWVDSSRTRDVFSRFPLDGWSIGKGTNASTPKQRYFPGCWKPNSSQTAPSFCVQVFLAICGVSPMLHGLLQIPKELAGRCRRLVFWAVAGLRSHSKKAHLSCAKPCGQAPSARQGGTVGRNGFRERHFRAFAAVGFR